jgi:hypothetical protein
MKMEARRLGLVEDIELDGVAGEMGLGSLVLLEYSSCNGGASSSGNCSPEQFRRRSPWRLKLEPADSIDTVQRTHIA